MTHTQDWHDGYKVGCADVAEAFRANLVAWITDRKADMAIGLCDDTAASLLRDLQEEIAVMAEEIAEDMAEAH